MKKLPRLLSRQIARFYPEQVLFRTTSPAFLPFYHVVSDKKLPYILNYPYCKTTEFENNLEYYLKYFKPVSLEYLLQNPKTKEKIFHLSFDDGLRECYEIIAPILLKKGIPATFFVNSGFVDNKALFHRYKASLILTELNVKPNNKAITFLKKNGLNSHNILQADYRQHDILNKSAAILGINFASFLKDQKPYLSSEQIIELQNMGFSIGAHSQNHPEFYKISDEEQLKEVIQSINWVTKQFHPKIKTFSFPFTDDGISKQLLKKLKSENICDISFGTAGLKYDEIDSHFQRFPAEDTGNFQLNVKAEWVYYKLRNALRKSTVKH